MNEIEAAGILLVAAFLSIVHYLSHRVSSVMERHHYKLLSFNGGLFLALLFLILLPEVVEFSDSVSVYLLILIGFVLFHFANKYLYQHVKDKNRMLSELKMLHDVGFFIDHFMLGFVLVTSTQFTPLGYLVAIAIFFHTVSSSIANINFAARTGTFALPHTAGPIENQEIIFGHNVFGQRALNDFFR